MDNFALHRSLVYRHSNVKLMILKKFANQEETSQTDSKHIWCYRDTIEAYLDKC